MPDSYDSAFDKGYQLGWKDGDKESYIQYGVEEERERILEILYTTETTPSTNVYNKYPGIIERILTEEGEQL